MLERVIIKGEFVKNKKYKNVLKWVLWAADVDGL